MGSTVPKVVYKIEAELAGVLQTMNYLKATDAYPLSKVKWGALEGKPPLSYPLLNCSLSNKIKPGSCTLAGDRKGISQLCYRSVRVMRLLDAAVASLVYGFRRQAH